MGKYRKKPVVIEAEQYITYGGLVKGMCNSVSCFTSVNNKPHVHTIHTNQLVNLEIGDWIIPEPDGTHFYPIKPDIFEATYEKVEDKQGVPDTREWISVEDKLPEYGEFVLAIIQHFHTKESKHVVLETVEKDDHFWEFDGCEISHEWNCIYWVEMPDEL